MLVRLLFYIRTLLVSGLVIASIVTLPTWFDNGRIGFAKAEVRQGNKLISPRIIPHVGHRSSAITSLAVSPDGNLIVSGDANGRMIVWDVARARELRTLSGIAKGIRSVAFDVENKAVAGVDKEGNGAVWDVRTGVLNRTIDADYNSAVAFDVSGKLMFTVTSATGFQIVDSASKAVLNSFPREEVSSTKFNLFDQGIEFGHSGNVLLAQGQIYEIKTGKRLPLHKVREKQQSILAISSDGRFFVTSENENRDLWESATGKLLHRYTSLPAGTDYDSRDNFITSAAFSNDARVLITGSKSGDIHVWMFAVDVTLETEKNDHLAKNTALVSSRNGALLLVGNKDGAIKIFRSHDHKELRMFKAGSAAITSLSISSDSRIVVTNDEKGSVKLWDVSTGTLLLTPLQSSKIQVSTDISADGSLLAIAAEGIKLWDVAAGKELHRFFAGATGPYKSVALSPNGNFLAAGGENGKVWDVKTGKEILELKSTYSFEDTQISHSIVAETSVAFSPGGDKVAGVGKHGVAIWDIFSGNSLAIETNPSIFPWSKTAYGPVAFSPDGNFVAYGDEDKPDILSNGNGRLVKIKSTKDNSPVRIQISSASDFEQFAFSHDSRLLTMWGTGTTVNFRSVLPDQSYRSLKGGAISTSAVALNKAGTILASSTWEGPVMLWDLNGNKLVRLLQDSSLGITWLTFSPDGKLLAGSSKDRPYIFFWDLATGNKIRTIYSRATWLTARKSSQRPPNPIRAFDFFERPQGGISRVAFSQNGKLVASGGTNGIVDVWDAKTGVRVENTMALPQEISSLAFAADGKTLNATSHIGVAKAWNVGSGNERTISENMGGVSAFSPDGTVLATSDEESVELWAIPSGRKMHRFPGAGAATSIAFTRKGDSLAIAYEDGTIALLDSTRWVKLATFVNPSGTTSSLAFSDNDSFLVGVAGDGSVRLWSVGSKTTREPVAGLYSFATGGVVTLPDGRFDTSSVDRLGGFHWLMPDDPLRALSPEIFLRDYYEPRLLPRLVACTQTGNCKREFKPVRPLVELNRVQPKVEIVSVRSGRSPETALVDVRVAETVDPSQKNGKTRTAVYDLRLYRGGQLVGQWPEPEEVASGATQGDELEAWRATSKVLMPVGHQEAVHTFEVPLAASERGKPVTFTAYAFNDDRVKSESALDDKYVTPETITPRVPRAYVVAVGINAYQNARRDLGFAVRDAQQLTIALEGIKGHEVVPIMLLSDSARRSNSERVVIVDQATKANIRAVLQMLAGKDNSGAARARLATVPEINQAALKKLAQATPDDLVVLAFSGHGYTSAGGKFYLLPSDSGAENRVTNEVLEKFISSDELSHWLRGVDAGQMAMIIDACHSAASIDMPGFKPGPMGDRGLGQLAYDKGMRILAASQADDVALESERLGHGLLTYALVRDGLGRVVSVDKMVASGKPNADLNGDGSVELSEWLQYGERRVPRLYEEIRAGRLRAVTRGKGDRVVVISRDPSLNPHFRTWVEKRQVQTPTLFDFQHTLQQSAVIVIP